MRKIFFVIPALLLSICLVFCSKADVKTALSNSDSTEQATNRGPCTVYIYPLTFATLTYCGTETNFTACSTCVGDTKGVEVITGDAELDFSGPTSFSISSATATSVILVTASNQIGPIAIAANGCEVFTVDANCVVN